MLKITIYQRLANARRFCIYEIAKEGATEKVERATFIRQI
ncbi:hypothetical protein VCRA2123O444_530007 [Vibrio crassostreae]|nr:hypothetical protein VCRA2119O432_410007 [Vibrio crassostreae]CAK2082310.1 hypothetical protein VCRA2114O423_410001 [Vibrio crassostreae]CAK2086832.1 hypothetical protein VCRA2114O421_430001 [Vibrio crassostreae]CAK2089498.1 hypothetical protein VCRA2113O412_420001 [Vibrio crassostreae]CAK2090157.1 hypothetical protein VCRA2113O409_430007 [Vibrio crassostreae]